MTDEAIVCHQTRDRIRLRVPSRKGDPDYFARIQAYLETLAGVTGVETSALTGSLLLLCPGSASVVLEALRGGTLLTLRESPRVRRPLATRTVEGFREVDAWVERSTGGELDLPSLALVGLIVAGIGQILRGNFTAPAWYTAFWYAASIALKAVPKEEKQDLL